MELVLLDDMGGIAIGVGAGSSLGVGEYINLAMSLFEGLLNLLRVQPIPPSQHLVKAFSDGMP